MMNCRSTTGHAQEVYFNGDGCCISQAAASMLVEKFDGKTVDEVKEVHRQGHARTVRRAADAQPAEVLPAVVAGVAGGHLLAQSTRPPAASVRTDGRRKPHDAPREPARSIPSSIGPIFPSSRRTVHDGVPLVYLDNAATTQRPRQVIQAIVDAYEQHYANVHRGIHTLSDEIDELYEEAREKVRAFINAPALRETTARHTEQVIFTSGTTAGDQPGGPKLGRRQRAARRRNPADRDGAPLEPRALVSVGRAHRRRSCATFR